MCGIAGIFDPQKISPDDIDLVKQMNTVQKHRGPDDEGLYISDTCVLGHRRLSIIDLSANGHQPFSSDCGRYQMTYNGEIYNYIELRAELENLGWNFRTHTDTEVLLKMYQHYGKDCLSKLNGMFAFAVYDTRQQQLFLARDRVGIKPLYYVRDGNRIYFASEIKALRLIPGLDTSLNNQSLFDYLVFNRTDIYDETFHKAVRRLPKGHWAEFRPENSEISPWWDAGKFAQTPNSDSLPEIITNIRKIMVSAVELRMRSDVPVGSCLSGGLDSSILVGLLYEHKMAGKGYPTFTISFPNTAVDETRYVQALNRKYRFDNHVTRPNADEALEQLARMTYAADEPTTGPSFYAQYRLAQSVRQNGITVLLDGQGGDESFAGYQYFHGFYLNGLLRQKRLGKFFVNLLKIITRGQDKTAYQTLVFQLLPQALRRRLLQRAHAYMDRDFFETHLKQSRIYHEFFDAPDLNGSLVRHFRYKLEHLLRIEDRNSMSHSIEARLPYLDYRLIEYVLSVREDFKIKAGETKYLQKCALKQYTIEEIYNRKDKIGFGVPPDWLASARWTEETRKAGIYCAKHFPDVFKQNFRVRLPRDIQTTWKFNQLAVWHRMIQSRELLK